MRTIQEVEKRLNAIAGFKTIESLEALIPETENTDEKEESIEEWIRINIGEEYLDDAVGKSDQEKQCFQHTHRHIGRVEAGKQCLNHKLSKGTYLRAGVYGDQVTGEGVLQGNTELVQFYGYCAQQGAGDHALEDVDCGGLDAGSPGLALNGYIKDGNGYTGNKQSPAEQCKQFNNSIDPA